MDRPPRCGGPDAEQEFPAALLGFDAVDVRWERTPVALAGGEHIPLKAGKHVALEGREPVARAGGEFLAIKRRQPAAPADGKLIALEGRKRKLLSHDGYKPFANAGRKPATLEGGQPVALEGRKPVALERRKPVPLERRKPVGGRGARGLFCRRVPARCPGARLHGRQGGGSGNSWGGRGRRGS